MHAALHPYGNSCLDVNSACRVMYTEENKGLIDAV